MSKTKKTNIQVTKRKAMPKRILTRVKTVAKGAGADLSIPEEENTELFFAQIGKSAAFNAINENKALGIPVTFLKNNQVVTKLPSGKLIVETELSDTPTRKIKKGTVLHVKL